MNSGYLINKKILVTGCGGMLGSSFYQLLEALGVEARYTDIDLNEEWLEYLDVREIKEVENAFIKFRPDIVLHLAALTDLEYCENNIDNAWKTNALGTENVALMCKKYNSIMIYISTAGIFDGLKKSYSDFDVPNPLSYYGKSKYYGEVAVERMLDKYYIFRAGWMMGGGANKDKKFINKIFKKINAGEKVLEVVDDKFGTPTYTKNFAESILKVAGTEYYGLYNSTGMGKCSRYDVACEFVRLIGLKEEIKVIPIKSEKLKQEYFAPRPESESLENLKLESRGINYMIDWKEALAEYSKEFIDLIKNKNENSSSYIKL